MGGLFYPTQVLLPLIGTKTSANVRTSVALTSAYQSETGSTPTKTFDVGGFTRVEFAILYTMGATETSNSIEAKLEWSTDGTNFYQFSTDSTSAGTSTMTKREFTHVGVNADVSPITWGIDIAYKDVVRISFKETGASSNAGSVFCEALLSGR
jgi:hypothetical protein